MKRMLLLVALLYIGQLAFAQQFRFGLQGSPLLSWMKGKDKIEADGVKLGYSFGLLFDYDITDNYAVSSGLSITHNAGKLDYLESVKFKVEGIFRPDSVFNDSVLVTTKADYIAAKYIEIPLTLKLKTNEIGYIKYFGQFGVTTGINIKAKAEFNTELPGSSVVNEVDKMNPLNLALTVGGGIEYSMGGNTSLIAAVLFHNGFLPVTRDEEKVILNNVTLRLGVMF